MCGAALLGSSMKIKIRERVDYGSTFTNVLQLHPSRVLLSSSSSSLLSLRGNEGGHPLLRALHQPAGDLARPGFSARSLCCSACYAAILLPSLCSWCQVTAPRAQGCRSSQMPLFFRPAACQKNSKADGSVSPQCMAARGVFDRDHDTTWTRLICMWGIYSIFYMQWERSAVSESFITRGGLG